MLFDRKCVGGGDDRCGSGLLDGGGAIHLVASAKRGDDRLIVVVLGSTSADSRYVDSRNLFRWAWLERGHKPDPKGGK